MYGSIAPPELYQNGIFGVLAHGLIKATTYYEKLFNKGYE